MGETDRVTRGISWPIVGLLVTIVISLVGHIYLKAETNLDKVSDEQHKAELRITVIETQYAEIIRRLDSHGDIFKSINSKLDGLKK